MKCVFCDGNTKVIETRKRNGKHFRRRECLSCGERFTTYEINQIQLFNILENYLPERLLDEISHSFAVGFPEYEKE